MQMGRWNVKRATSITHIIVTGCHFTLRDGSHFHISLKRASVTVPNHPPLMTLRFMSGPLLDWHPLVSLSYGFDVCSNLSWLTCFLVFISKSEKKKDTDLLYRVLKYRFVNDIDSSECRWDSMLLFRDSCFDQDQWYVYYACFFLSCSSPSILDD